MNMIDIKLMGTWPQSKYTLTKGNLGRHKADSTENPLLLWRIVDLGDKDEQLNFIQCIGNGIFMNTDATRSGHL